MRKFYRITMLFVASFLVSTGCDDFTDIDPQYTQDADNYFNDPADYQKALISAYDLLQTSYLGFWIGEIASDNSIAGGESATDTEGLHQIDAMTHGGVNNELRNIWRWNYAGITRANIIFENKDNIEFAGKEDILAQAAFLRGYYYFQLVKFFGDVPLIVDKRLSIGEVTSVPRTPKAEVYALIEADLALAAEGLEWTNPVKGRITKGAALALLGKVYLYQNKFGEAATTLERVINEGPYDLFPDYNGIFRQSNEGNSEVAFDIQYTGIEGGGYDCFVCLEGFAAAGFQGIRGYNGPVYVDGNSYNLPTQDLADAFEEGDSRLQGAILDIEEFISSQPNSADITYVEGIGGHTGYYNNKYSKRADELGAPDTDLTSPLNHVVIRFADVLLMAAEAHAKKPGPNEDLARQYVNRVRARTGVELDPITSSGAELLDDIFHERRVEFAGEGLRFFDLVRTGRAAEEIEGFKTGTHEVFPIPQAEIDLAGGSWEQNTGY